MEFGRHTQRAICLLHLCVVIWVLGCAASDYRQRADRETYCILNEKSNDPRWQTPNVSITPAADSRNFDPHAIDCPPMPPDDPASHGYMHCVDGKTGYALWHDNGDAAEIENVAWLDAIPFNQEGLSAKMGLDDFHVWDADMDEQQVWDVYTHMMAT